MKHIPYEGTDDQRANLIKLADFLDRSVPPPEFSMEDFLGTRNRDILDDKGREKYWSIPLSDLADMDVERAYRSCGTVACACGHGPLAGIPIPNGVTSWWEYSSTVFGIYEDDDSWSWCFAASWKSTDNTPRGAAARIRYMLNHGVPDNSFYQRNRLSPLCYTVPPEPVDSTIG